MNYFNYFTEIEEEFVRQRGSHLLISPLDWSLIETWKQRGIPLHVVLRGISASFVSYDAKSRRGRKVNSLFYCQQEVEAGFLEYVESRVGSNHEAGNAGNDRAEKINGNDAISRLSDSGSPFSRAAVIEYLTGQREQIQRLSVTNKADAQLSETFSRATRRLTEIMADLKAAAVVWHEKIESDLTLVEEMMLEGLKQNVGAAVLTELQREGDQQLRAWRKGMEARVYEQTRNNYVAQRLRERFRVPRLSLFYL